MAIKNYLSMCEVVVRITFGSIYLNLVELKSLSPCSFKIGDELNVRLGELKSCAIRWQSEYLNT